MSDLRARLIKALLHGLEETVTESSYDRVVAHLADKLLSTPGIIIVQTDVLVDLLKMSTAERLAVMQAWQAAGFTEGQQ